MHILVGRYKNRRLESASSERVRPTARRLREALFDFLAHRIIGAHFLDLCAGSGAVGIEALSRGAGHLTFVDRSRIMLEFIELNLKRCDVDDDQATIVLSDALEFLEDLSPEHDPRWNVAFLDPPYSTDYAPVLAAFGSGTALSRKGGILVVEHHCDTRLQDIIGCLRRWRVIRQGQSCLSFYERK